MYNRVYFRRISIRIEGYMLLAHRLDLCVDSMVALNDRQSGLE